MHWLIYLLISAVIGIAGLFCGGGLGSLFVRWFRVSSFEGGAGYFVVGLALAGGLVGVIAGLTTAIITGPREGLEYLRTLGLGLGSLLGLAGVVLGIGWIFADLPPRLDGHDMMLEVELRMPVGADRPQGGADDASLSLHAVSGMTVRKSNHGRLDLGAARLEDGRWIVPGSVYLFTRSGRRSLEFRINREVVAGFIAPVPARPGRDLLAWSDWYPRPHPPQPAWPDDRASFRFRVQPILPPPPGPSPAEVAERRAAEEQAAFDAIPADAPVRVWLEHVQAHHPEGRRQAALERILARSDWVGELSGLMCHDEADTASRAMRVVPDVREPSEALEAGVVAAGRDVLARLRSGVAIGQQDNPSYYWAADISVRFSAWMAAVRALRDRRGSDVTGVLGEILEVARTRDDSIVMRADVVRVASYYLHQWAGVEPLPTDPRPR